MLSSGRMPEGSGLPDPAPQSPTTSQRLRLVGLDLEYINDYRQEFSRNAALYRALAGRLDVVGRMSPVLTRGQMLVNRMRQFHPHVPSWRRNTHFNPQLFEQRTEISGQYLNARRGQYDVILQTYLQFAPAPQPPGRPYGLYLDATYEMSRRHYPEDHPLSARATAHWLRLERATYQGAARMFTWSDFTARSLIEDYGCDPARVVRVGAGTNLMAPSLAEKRYDSQVALFVGIDFGRKGGHDVLQAFREVRQQMPEAELWIVGPRLPKAAPQPGVRWLGRIQDRARLSALYRHAQLFVMPSFEPWGHVFCEAMGHGLPCIALSVGPASEIVQAEQTGLQVERGSPQALAGALLRLLGDPALAERMGRQAYAEVQQRFTWDLVADRLLPHLEAMAQGE
ncbi:glycosyltransferase family 4 protein [Deinococcus navajonensis]|uniref:Glycosyltransferase family 4 protein n=1 Tax=Deinococcus navajonensis TaxID=309884 RepID=A0ABV8XN63_9DEIO